MKPNSNFVKDKAFVGGRWISCLSKATFAVTNPANGEQLSLLPDMTGADATLAIDAAAAAFPAWSRLSALQRADILMVWSKAIADNADALALLMTCEQGKPLSESRGETLGAAGTIRWCAEEGRRQYGEFIEGAKPDTKIIISRHPVGVAAAITPWNFPISMITRKVGPALAAGCTVVLKPAEATPLCALALADLAQKVGLPDGVLNIVTSSNAADIGAVFTSDPRVAKISFTGSTAVGRKLMAQAAQNIQKISLELGGNAPFIIFPSADLDRAVDGAIASKFRNAGQTCICANRIYVHESIYKPFCNAFQSKISSLKMGYGWGKDIDLGPLINMQAIEKIEKLIEAATASGAKVLCGGKRHSLGGSFYEPTLITDVDEGQPIAKEEIFGPVAVLYPFSDEQDVIRRANDSPYGLATYIYTQDLGQALRASDALQYGMVGVNESMLATDLAPFGGIKTSGIGKEGGQYGLNEYSNVKYRLFGGSADLQ